ncbi:MAG: FlgD immunoglobulin-like domain containing protein [bacterium]|nr:FlgD immunoglobulin-like domain containing protein [bacterium]
MMKKFLALFLGLGIVLGIEGIALAQIHHLSIITPQRTACINQPTFDIIVQTQDAANNPVNVTKDTKIALTTTSKTGEFSLGVDPWTPVTTVTIAGGESQISFHYKDTTIGEYTITVSESPSAGWEDCSQTVTIIDDDEPPTITEATGDVEATTGDPLEIWAKIKDNVKVSEVRVYYLPIGGASYVDLPMRDQGDDVWVLILAGSRFDKEGEIPYYIIACDAAGNETIDPPTETYKITVKDDDPPKISGATGDIITATTGEDEEISATITDNIGVDRAILCYTPIGGTEKETDFVKRVGGDTWNAILPVAKDKVGTITYYIKAKDSAGNERRLPTGNGVYNVTVTDNDPPFVSLSDDNPTKAESGERIKIKGDFGDNIGVTEAILTWTNDAIDAPDDWIDFKGKSAILKIRDDFTGSFQYTLTVRDAAGNSISETDNTVVVADRTSPVISNATGNTKATTGDPIEISATVTDNVRVASVDLWYKRIGDTEYKKAVPQMENKGDGDVYSKSLIMEDKRIGEVEYYIIAEDTSGNKTRDPADSTYKITVKDNDPPEITNVTGDILAGTEDDYKKVTATITDNLGIYSASIFYTPIGEAEIELSLTKDQGSDIWQADIPIKKDKVGVITYYVKARDESGNEKRNPKIGSYKIEVSDNTPPEVSLSDSNPTSAQAGDKITIRGDFSDNILVTKARLTWSPSRAISFPDSPVDFMNKSVDLTITKDYSGIINYQVEVEDATGNSASESATIAIGDDTPPEIKNVTGDISGTTGDLITIGATVTDNMSVKKVSLHYKKIGEVDETIVTMPNDSGDYYEIRLEMPEDKVGIVSYYVVAEDNSGLTARKPKEGSYGIKVTDNDPPQITNVQPGDVPSTGTGNDIEITCEITDNVELDTATLHYTPIDKPETTTPFTFGTSAKATLPVANDKVGTITYYIKAKDKAGNITRDPKGSGYYVVNVVDDEEPRAWFEDTNPTQAGTGEKVTIRGDFSDNIGVTSSVLTWDNDAVSDADGKIDFMGKSAELKIKDGFKGKFTYLLTVKDEAGNIGTAKGTITVSDVTPPKVASVTGDTSGTTGESVKIGITVTDNVGIKKVNIYYREIGAEIDTVKEMEREGDDVYAWTIKMAPDKVGIIPYYIIIFDTLDNERREPLSGEYKITVTDNDPPTVQDVPGDISTNTGKDVEIEIRLDDNIGIKGADLYYTPIDGREEKVSFRFGSPATATISVARDKIGKIPYYIKVKDLKGNETRVPKGDGYYEVTVNDNEPPVIVLSPNNPTNAESGGTVTIEADLIDNISVKEAWLEYTTRPPGGIVSPASPVDFMDGTADLKIKDDFRGRIDYKVVAIDTSNNKEEKEGEIFVSDTEPPTIEKVTGDTEGTTGDPVQIEATVTDNTEVENVTLYWTNIGKEEDKVEMTTSGGDVYKATIQLDKDKVGKANYYIIAEDVAGKEARDPKDGTYTITITDDDPPIITGGGDTSSTTGEDKKVTAKIIDNIKVKKASLFYTPIDGTEKELPLTLDQNGNTEIMIPVARDKVGTIEYYLQAEDESGNKVRLPTGDGTYKIKVTDNDQPTLILSNENPKTAKAGDIITIATQVMEDNIEITEATLQYEPDEAIVSPPEPVDFMKGTVELEISKDFIGKIKYEITVKDEANNSVRESREIIVSDNTPPTIEKATGDTEGTTGDPVKIEATVKDNVELKEEGVTLHYYKIGAVGETVLVMDKVGDDVYSKTIEMEDKEGEVEYYIVAVDKDENEARDPKDGTYKISVKDDDPPIIKVTEIKEATTGDPVELRATITDNVELESANLYYKPIDGEEVEVKIKLPGKKGGGTKTTIPIAKDKVGKITYYLKASDKAGNEIRDPYGEGEYEIEVRDDDKPIIILNSDNPLKADTGDTITIRATITDNIGVKKSVLRYEPSDAIEKPVSPVEFRDGRVDLTISKNFKGDLRYWVEAEDLAGNKRREPTGDGRHTISIGDTISPEITELKDLEVEAGKEVVVEAKVTDNITGDIDKVTLEYSPKDKATPNSPVSMVYNPDTKRYEVTLGIASDYVGDIDYYVRASDLSKNESTSGNYKIKVVDKEPPVISGLYNISGTTGDEVVVTCKVSDNISDGVKDVRLYYEPDKAIEDTKQPVYLTYNKGKGQYEVGLKVASDYTGVIDYYIEAEDIAGNVSMSRLYNISVTDNDKPTVRLTESDISSLPFINPTTAIAGDQIKISVEVSDNVSVEDATLRYKDREGEHLVTMEIEDIDEDPGDGVIEKGIATYVIDIPLNQTEPITYSVIVTDKAGNKNKEIKDKKILVQLREVRKSIGPDGGTIKNGGLTLEIPEGALSKQTNITVKPTDKPEITGFKTIGGTFELAPKGLLFRKPVRLTMEYNPESDEFKQAGIKDESQIGIFFYDGYGWLKIPSKVDKEKDMVIAEIDHFTKYTLGIDVRDPDELLTDVICTENPFSPNGQNLVSIQCRTSALEGRMEVRIYDSIGHLVWERINKFSSTQPGTVEISWDGKDERGDIVDNGIYVYQVKIVAGNEEATKVKAIGIVK